MINPDLVVLSRLQFGMTALYHFLFVPLTLGLSVLLGIMETVYVMTGKQIWRDMTKFWGVLFGINFVMGVSTGITMEFQFGTNWAYYSHYVGDIFGVPLAIEGMMAFFLEATFVGMFFFGWNRLSKGGHLAVTWMVALGTNLSALWILIANGWMQHPTGSYFNFHTMRMEVKSFYDVLFNPVAQAKFVHTISAGYVTGSVFVLAISAFYLLRGRCVDLAKRSMIIAAGFGLASALSVVVLGDESGYLANQDQKMKIAAMEGMWETEKAPASFNLIGFPDQAAHETHATIQVPYLLGLIATRSLDQPLYGINDLVKQNQVKIQDGLQAYQALTVLMKEPENSEAQAEFRRHEENLGYALLLKRQRDDILQATPVQIETAAWDTVPKITPIFWSFRLMVACGFWFIALFVSAFYLSIRGQLTKPCFLWAALLSLPLPWLAAELGWVVAELGRQPWVIEGILPTFLGTSSLTTSSVWISVFGFVALYSFLACIELYLMIKYVRLGPEYSLNQTGKDHA